MPRGGGEYASDRTPDALRKQAAHARRLAKSSGDDKASRDLAEFAEELEASAAALEQRYDR
jgi:hypothetical protein